MYKHDLHHGTVPAGTEGGRPRPTGVPAGTVEKKDPEVIARITRRRLTNFYKLKVVKKVIRSGRNSGLFALCRTAVIIIFPAFHDTEFQELLCECIPEAVGEVDELMPRFQAA